MKHEAEIILKRANGRMMTSVKASDEETLINTLCTGFVIALGEVVKDYGMTDEEKRSMSEACGEMIRETLYDRMTGKTVSEREVLLKDEAAKMLKEKMLKGEA